MISFIPTQDVIEVCKKHIKSTACGFDSPKLNLHVGDGFAFMEQHKNQFDVVISDTSDPVGKVFAFLLLLSF